jgi:hypothetical protein
MATSSSNFGNGCGSLRNFYGDKGVLKLGNWNAPTYSAQGGPRRGGSIRGENDVTPIDRPDHFLDWLQSMRANKQPHAPTRPANRDVLAIAHRILERVMVARSCAVVWCLVGRAERYSLFACLGIDAGFRSSKFEPDHPGWCILPGEIVQRPDFLRGPRLA